MIAGQLYDICLAECDLEDEQATTDLGKQLEPWLQAGDLIGLEGEMGAGKSVLARGLIRSAMTRSDQPDADIPSPTYTLVQHYPRLSPDANQASQDELCMIWHVDLWRIDTPEDVLEFGLEEAMAAKGDAICVIEWVSKLGAFLPPHGLLISLTGAPTNDHRKARFLVTSGHETYWRNMLTNAGILS
ncbi:MAG: tRNA (adenosine(37)-N6)-threonylcarbamoyltransferase complex ATPase subunit type 1 TsaE [Alphaproteobacteria bacterium]|nr:tRNA (adenosine(37)-N6)-threonylcarbamoyltransferase complex ATPase subunit type 1 TsaE [Alphaproteobacteria bacterium]